MRTPRLLLICLLALATGVCALVLVVGHRDVRRDEPQAVTAADSRATRALAVLRRWDRRRAAAWADGDPDDLARLYVAGSSARRRDLTMLAAYRARGLRVRSLHRQVLAVRVLPHRPDRLRLRVTDRLVDAVAIGAGVRAALPTGRVQTRLITLRLVHHAWRVAGVRPLQTARRRAPP